MLTRLACARPRLAARSVWANACVHCRPLCETKQTLEPERKKGQYGEIGPPDPVSNIRPIRLFSLDGESPEERRYREQLEELQAFHHTFWEENNTLFMKQKKEFEEARKNERGGGSLTADDFAEFYDGFLRANQERQMAYNRLWWRKSFSLLLPGALATQKSMLRRLKGMFGRGQGEGSKKTE
eukprot:comp22335_c0_seq1/m.33216 comp22335_c0_seq1/g.33216  ORF comp22335_c0_seq1/g.33216 comp22335_c0_seq1/m.33216 type:complete len:183 (-) comp22335_c0_seq1:153-701(-)